MAPKSKNRLRIQPRIASKSRPLASTNPPGFILNTQHSASLSRNDFQESCRRENETLGLKCREGHFFPFPSFPHLCCFLSEGLSFKSHRTSGNNMLLVLTRKEKERGEKEKRMSKQFFLFSDEKQLPLQRCDSLEKRLLIFVN